MWRLVFSVLFLSSFINVFGQRVLSGTVLNDKGEPLSGVSVYDVESFAGTSTNSKGAYELKLKEGKHVIAFEYLGYRPSVDTIELTSDLELSITLEVSPFLTQEVVVSATRATNRTPIAYENIDEEQIERLNLGQDMPIILNQSVSAVTTSDAGAGVGYTGIRIRGSDATRINVTVNGVPLNDAESHGVFWVNMPDFASTTQGIQIQRGVGTSTNGAAAFGATINLETSKLDTVPFAEVNNSYGSFNTRRHNAIVNTGLINNRFNVEARLSYIASDGYIDRSAADLRSYYIAGGYYGKKFMLKAVTFAGKEVTQQAWYGTPQSRIDGDEQAMLDHAAGNGYTESQTENLLNSGRTYNYYQYDNEIDNYAQDHYQLISGFQLSDKLYLNVTGHYTYGRGYFEQFDEGASLSEYGLSEPVIGNDTVRNADVIARRWLDNDFYGAVYSLQYKNRGFALTVGGSANQYEGDHFGEVIWSQIAPDANIRDRYYESTSTKLDVSNYLKAEWVFGNFSLYTDAQVRYIDYQSQGVDNDQRPIDIDDQHLFFNPKAGVNFALNDQHSFYASVALGSREPSRGDHTDAVPGTVPQPEFLTDYEAGWMFKSRLFTSTINLYYMDYNNQLVLTGEVNDVGSPIRTNVSESYRAGIEWSGRLEAGNGFYWSPNATFSQNKIVRFTETIYDYTTGFDIVEIEHSNTDIAFSPSIIAGSQLGYAFDFGLDVSVLSKYVGEQFLDNTSNSDRAIDAYFVNDFRLSYSIEPKFMKQIEFSLLVNNFLNEVYESNGYTYSFIAGELVTENFYYPQAGTNYLAGLKLRF